MKRRVFLGLAAAGALAGCGGFRESRANPRNWFGRSRSRTRKAAVEEEPVNPLIPKKEESGLFDRMRKEKPYAGTLVAEITDLEVERASGGAIIRVRGRATQQEIYDVRLVPDDPDGEPIDGVLGYQLRAVHPADAPDRPREVLAAVFASDKTLEKVREIRVRGAQNEHVSRR
jgi:hypothetical protein